MGKDGARRDYESAYLRRTFRDGAKVRNETVANLSMLPPAAVAAIEAWLTTDDFAAVMNQYN